VSQGIKGDWSFTAPGMRSAVKVRGTVGNSADRDHSWQVEVRIPFADLGGPAPRAGDVWRANFYRLQPHEGPAGRAAELVAAAAAGLPPAGAVRFPGVWKVNTPMNAFLTNEQLAAGRILRNHPGAGPATGPARPARFSTPPSRRGT
jgi:hypothetical protein